MWSGWRAVVGEAREEGREGEDGEGGEGIMEGSGREEERGEVVVVVVGVVVVGVVVVVGLGGRRAGGFGWLDNWGEWVRWMVGEWVSGGGDSGMGGAHVVIETYGIPSLFMLPSTAKCVCADTPR